jgi:hypothetical protein
LFFCPTIWTPSHSYKYERWDSSSEKGARYTHKTIAPAAVPGGEDATESWKELRKLLLLVVCFHLKDGFGDNFHGNALFAV